MRRRDFLATSIAFTELLASRRLVADQRRRAAVVIGVNKSGSLPVLSAAVSGARSVADWLESEQQFEVRRFLDVPVTVRGISVAIAELVNRGTLDQLVVYFSGHGFLINGSEMWMLSAAPEDPNEAVSLGESIDLARATAIPHVVFISDACRSLPDSLLIQRVRGSLIFPNTRSRPSGRDVAIDRFLAARAGEPALELPVAKAVGEFEGIYTSSFLDAFEHPQGTMVQTLGGIEVVSNWSLKEYLVDDVPKRARAKSIQLQQFPDSIVESGEKTYIGRVIRRGSPPPLPPPQATISDLAAAELRSAGLDSLAASARPSVSQEDLSRLNAATGFAQARRAIIDATGPGHFETQTGFSVNGASVVSALSSKGVSADLLEQGDGGQRPAIIRVGPSSQPPPTGSVMLRFADGSGTVVAALGGYIGTITVDHGRVVNLSYMPSQNNWRWGSSQLELQHLVELRATVATAARFGAFRIEGNRDERATNGRRLADRIRVLKAIDPTLGLYAAYAYADAGIDEQVRSVREIMLGDLQSDVFDVAMLANGLSASGLSEPRRVVPVCPMLAQGWGWLRVRGVRLPPKIEQARDHLLPALWTTFDSEGMKLIDMVIREAA